MQVKAKAELQSRLPSPALQNSLSNLLHQNQCLLQGAAQQLRRRQAARRVRRRPPQRRHGGSQGVAGQRFHRGNLHVTRRVCAGEEAS